MPKLPFEMGVARFDNPPPEKLVDLSALQAQDAFRFANQLRGWIDVENGGVTGYGQDGGGHIGSTTVNLGGRSVTFTAVPFPDIRPDPEVGADYVRFVQTAGGRTGAPAPRRVARPPFIRVDAPLAWTTLSLTIYADGPSRFEVLGASSFPRHWIYDESGSFAAKVGLVDFKSWWREAFAGDTPWGSETSAPLVTAAESAAERALSRLIMGEGRRVKRVVLAPGEVLVQQGDEGFDVFLLLDGVLQVEVDGDLIADVGPGAILGERALLEAGRRTSTLRAVTESRAIKVDGRDLDPTKLEEIGKVHSREQEIR